MNPRFREVASCTCPQCRSGLLRGLALAAAAGAGVVAQPRLSQWLLAQEMAGMADYERKIRQRKVQVFGPALDGVERLVEVGVGAGVNFPYFKQAGVKQVIAVEPNPNFLAPAEAAASRAGVALDVRSGVMEELPFPDSSVDAVVGTLVLCSVREPSRAVEEVRRVLRPGGRYIFTEHVAAEQDDWLCSVQNLLDPLQQTFAAGCHLNRQPLPLIRSSFDKVTAQCSSLGTFPVGWKLWMLKESVLAIWTRTRWADLCAALATLGLEVLLWPFEGKKCPNIGHYQNAHIIYTDYNGVHAGKAAGNLPPADKTWLLDTFGTDGTVVEHSFFGRIPPLTDYPLHRFLTLVPGFSARNTFLGVAVAGGKDEAPLPDRQWQCVLWSKVHPWLSEKNGFPAYHSQLLREYSKHCKVIATIDSKDTYKTGDLIRSCCPDVEIRGVLSPQEFHDLLRGSAVYVGVGEPLIAPSCFEALSLGTHVVQPRFPEPRVLRNKPITQNWTSQHPFLEKVPEPFAFTIDPLDVEAIASTFRTLRRAFDSVYARGDAEAVDLRRFYSAGTYPGREDFSIRGFLKRVAGTVSNTRTLEAADWDWERQHHPQCPRGSAWPCLAMHGFAWLCMALHGFAWLCMAMHGHAWPCLAAWRVLCQAAAGQSNGLR
ncbi:unnamed protein product, partial [Effrenium voratum]